VPPATPCRLRTSRQGVPRPTTPTTSATSPTESLLFAENGNSIGAIQIAGTAEPSQLPFFVAACDYTLIGEEFFAASAYLSGERDQLGSIQGQDLGKLFAAAVIIIGCALATAGLWVPACADGAAALRKFFGG